MSDRSFLFMLLGFVIGRVLIQIINTIIGFPSDAEESSKVDEESADTSIETNRRNCHEPKYFKFKCPIRALKIWKKQFYSD